MITAEIMKTIHLISGQHRTFSKNATESMTTSTDNG
jgi:hypothetical protein